jgi:tetratricopeptide (TPR) repeat protein
MDSLKRVVPGLKGMAKVDDLNTIVDIYQILDDDNQMQVDSATPYATQSYNEAKRVGYKRGLGYSYLKMSYCEILQAGINSENNSNKKPGSTVSIEQKISEAMRIGGELNDNVMIGSAYVLLGRTENLKGNNGHSIDLLKKAIELFQRPVKQTPLGTYREMNYSDCDGCNGNEFRLAEHYMELSGTEKDYNLSIEYLKKAIGYYQKAGDKSAVGNVYLGLGNSITMTTGFEAGIEYTKKSILYFHEDGNENGELLSYINLCAKYWNLGDFENGLVYSKKGVMLAEKLIANKTDGNVKSVELGQAYYWMSRFYSIGGDYETALRFIRKAHDYYPDNNIRMNDAWAAEIGEVHRLIGNYDSAMFYLAPFATKTDAPPIGKTYLVHLYISLKQFDKALPLINKNIEITAKSNNWGNLGLLYTDAAKIWLGKKDYQTALSNARAGFVLLTKTKRNIRLIDNYQILSDIFNKLNKNDSAYIYLKQYTILKDSFLNRQFYIRLNDYKKEAEEEKKTSQINLLNKDNQLKQQKLKQEALVRNSLIAGLILLSLLAVFIFRTLTIKRKSELQKQQLENEKKQAELQQKTVELEMQALRAQMNPHFIFNCLSSINKFILKNDTEAASDYLTRFSRLIRLGLINSQLSLIPLGDEVEMLRLYLDMERLRFSENFDYNIIYGNTIEPETIYIPPMLLQPFCENAIWHGLMHKDGQGKLEIMMSIEDGQLQCSITDNGIGREKAAELKTKSGTKQKSFGLKITTERLALFNNEKAIHAFYRTEDVLDSNKNVAGTKVTLNIKLKRETAEPVKEMV